MDWTKDQLAKLLAKSMRESRKNCKRYLHDLGGSGSAEELDEALAIASANTEIVKMANKIDQDRMQTAANVDKDVEVRVDLMRADILDAMERKGLSIADLAILCRLSGDLVSSIVYGDREPTVEQLVKIASSLERRWRLI